MIKERNLAVCIILSIVTCGIYAIYWWVVATNEMNEISASTESTYHTSGAMAVILTIITCGIYGFYWSYKMGEKLDMLNEGSSNAVLFLILELFGLNIVNLALMQNSLNKYANA